MVEVRRELASAECVRQPARFSESARPYSEIGGCARRCNTSGMRGGCGDWPCRTRRHRNTEAPPTSRNRYSSSGGFMMLYRTYPPKRSGCSTGAGWACARKLRSMIAQATSAASLRSCGGSTAWRARCSSTESEVVFGFVPMPEKYRWPGRYRARGLSARDHRLGFSLMAAEAKRENIMAP
jgi:hypothetical protein